MNEVGDHSSQEVEQQNKIENQQQEQREMLMQERDHDNMQELKRKMETPAQMEERDRENADQPDADIKSEEEKEQKEPEKPDSHILDAKSIDDISLKDVFDADPKELNHIEELNSQFRAEYEDDIKGYVYHGEDYNEDKDAQESERLGDEGSLDADGKTDQDTKDFGFWQENMGDYQEDNRKEDTDTDIKERLKDGGVERVKEDTELLENVQEMQPDGDGTVGDGEETPSEVEEEKEAEDGKETSSEAEDKETDESAGDKKNQEEVQAVETAGDKMYHEASEVKAEAPERNEVSEQLDDIERTQKILEQTDMTAEEVADYLDTNYYFKPEYGERFREEGIISRDVLIPRKSDYLDEDGAIDWSSVPQGGFVLKEDGSADKEEIKNNLSEKNRLFDRFGSDHGFYLSPAGEDGRCCSYEQRAMPFVEDEASRHIYEEVGNLDNIAGDIAKSDLPESRKAELYDRLDKAGGKAYCGVIAKAFDQEGGGEQIELPLRVSELVEIGTLRECK